MYVIEDTPSTERLLINTCDDIYTMLNKCASVLAKLLLITIRLYQLLVVPLLPRNCCRYYPSCSNYAASAIHKYGVLRGIWFALKRLLRCHPGASGGYDPLP